MRRAYNADEAAGMRRAKAKTWRFVNDTNLAASGQSFALITLVKEAPRSVGRTRVDVERARI
jgi:hypothetical protein